MIGYSIGSKTTTCIVGSYEKSNYIFLYNDLYYDIVEASKLDLFTCSELTEIGVIGD